MWRNTAGLEEKKRQEKSKPESRWCSLISLQIKNWLLAEKTHFQDKSSFANTFWGDIKKLLHPFSDVLPFLMSCRLEWPHCPFSSTRQAPEQTAMLFSSLISCPHSKFSHGLDVSEVELKVHAMFWVFFPPCRDTSACITGNRFGWKAAIEFTHNADTRAGQYTEVALQMVVNKAKEGNTWTFPKIKLFVLANWDLRGRKSDWNIQVHCGLEILAFVHFCALQKIVWTTKPGSHFIPYINLLFVILIALSVAIQHIPKYLVVN